MLYGLTGSHRSGKTTLAKKVAEDLGIEFYATSITEVARRNGFDPVAPMSLSDRVDLQYRLLEDHLEQLAKRSRPLITDRTPLDMLGYMLCEFHMSSHLVTTSAVLDRASHFQDICLAATVQNYDMLFYLAPLKDYVVEDGKPVPNRAYQKHHALMVQGGLSQLAGQTTYMLIENNDFEFRRNVVHSTIVSRIDNIDTARSSAHMH